MMDWTREKNDVQLIVSFRIRHLLDPDFRNALQDIVSELRSRSNDWQAQPDLQLIRNR
jgi:hypothetical protein